MDASGVVGLVGVVVGLLGLTLALLAYADTRRLRARLVRLAADPAVVAGVDPKAVRNVALVRYDAFADQGGQMSYSVALLDAAGDGVVLTAINGRSETRAYAKGVTGGSGTTDLTPEERQALAAALS